MNLHCLLRTISSKGKQVKYLTFIKRKPNVTKVRDIKLSIARVLSPRLVSMGAYRRELRNESANLHNLVALSGMLSLSIKSFMFRATIESQH